MKNNTHKIKVNIYYKDRLCDVVNYKTIEDSVEDVMFEYVDYDESGIIKYMSKLCKKKFKELQDVVKYVVSNIKDSKFVISDEIYIEYVS